MLIRLAALAALVLMSACSSATTPDAPEPDDPIGAEVVLVSSQQTYLYQLPAIVGVVKNVGNRTAILVRITYKVYGAADALLDTGYDDPGVSNIIDGDAVWSILPGQEAPFEVFFYQLNSWYGVTGVTYDIRWTSLE